MSAYLSAVFGAGAQFFDDQGRVLAGGSINTFLAGTSTPATTYTDSTAAVQNGPTMTLDAAGRTPQELWILSGQSLKYIVKNSVGVQIGQAWDNIQGVNDPLVAPTTSQWTLTALSPSDISATQFSVIGDHTGDFFQVGRRVQYTLGSGVAYGLIKTVSFSGGLTTITIVPDSVNLDNTMSVINVASLTSVNQSLPYAPLAGKYTPTLVNLVNIATSSNNGQAKWIRSGNNVIVFGNVTITPTAGGGASTVLTLSLPFASATANVGDVAGSATDTTSLDPATINVASGLAALYFNASTNGSRSYNYIFGYEIL